MDYELEKEQAVRAGKRALLSLSQALSELERARTWGIFDILGNGGLSSLLKHSKLRRARLCIDDANRDLREFSRELGDLQLDSSLQISDLLTVFDFFESTFADVMVQIRINDAITNIKLAMSRVNSIINRLS